MKNKQTAVDWLVKEFNLESYKATIAFVKEMEKQQIIYAHIEGSIYSDSNCFKLAEIYYNETFKK